MWPFRKSLKLVCGGCHQVYKIGVDSIIVTADDVAETFANSQQLKAVGAFSQAPDLVALTEGPAPEWRGRRGRSWRCRKCEQINL